MSTIEKHMTENFQLLSGNLSPAEAIAQLQEGYYGIAIDDNEKPFAIFLPEDLQKVDGIGAVSLLNAKVSLPPTIVVGCSVEMEEFASSSAKRVLIREKEARGAIVIDDSKPVGVLTIPQFQAYLGSGEYVIGGGELGDSVKGNIVNNLGLSTLWGQHRQTTWVEICTVCSSLNYFTEDEWKKMKQNLNNPNPTVQQQMPTCQNTTSSFGLHTFNPA